MPVMKRKQADLEPTQKSTPTKKRRAVDTGEARQNGCDQLVDKLATQLTPSKRSMSRKCVGTFPREVTGNDGGGDNIGLNETPTTTANGDAVILTASKSGGNHKMKGATPSKTSKADRSAKRKSASALSENQDEDDWEGNNALAQEILDEQGDEMVEEDGNLSDLRDELQEGEDGLLADQAETPSKRGRGRPKGAKNKRSPTPEGNIPPEERYFFQNRPGPPHVSNNTLASVKLLTHEEYYGQMRQYKDHHDPEKRYLMRLHARSFPQWLFELEEGFNICLYGWGSKRQLVNHFADWLSRKLSTTPVIVIVNAYAPKLSLRSILSTLASAIMESDAPVRLTGQPIEMLDTITSYLATNPSSRRIILLINSIDSPSGPLRRSTVQTVLAKLAAHPRINLLVTADTPTFTLLWSSTLLDQFRFIFHDCTTFAPYDAELIVVDSVHELLGRKGHRIGGKDGVEFVLKSLPENARSLYRILLSELLTLMSDDLDGDGGNIDPELTGQKAFDLEGQLGIDYRVLYQKASEEFVCSSEMNFRTLLKEFHDHQMIVSRRDASGTEVLGVPLGKEDLEGVLEDLVMG